jgi:hypothetical protein
MAEVGILYVIFNKWIRNPETNEMPYKIGITKRSVADRYYGLGLKMPGKFETLFAYKLKNYADAEKALGIILNERNINGEWYDLNENNLIFIEATCKQMNGILITEEIENEIQNATEPPVDLASGDIILQTQDVSGLDSVNILNKKYGLSLNNKNTTNNQQTVKTEQLRYANDSDEHHTYDNTQYKFMGNLYRKNRLVLAIINDYIQKHDNCTLESLQTTFPKRLQGNLGVVDTFENANEIYTRTKHKRHFLNNRITLRSGQQIVVCTQWDIGNINQFINKAREIGYNIDEIK